jgi:hypothetical protein
MATSRIIFAVTLLPDAEVVEERVFRSPKPVDPESPSIIQGSLVDPRGLHLKIDMHQKTPLTANALSDTACAQVQSAKLKLEQAGKAKKLDGGLVSVSEAEYLRPSQCGVAYSLSGLDFF